MNKVVLSLGSNSSNCQEMMGNCIEWLSTIVTNLKISHSYFTEALNGKDKDYINAVAEGCVYVDYDKLKQQVKQYELSMGRTPESKKQGIIPIDIDIVIWNEEIINETDYNQSYFQIGFTALNVIKNGK